MSSWLEAVPGRTVELRMFAQGLVMTDEPANIKAIMSTEVRVSNHGCEGSEKILTTTIVFQFRQGRGDPANLGKHDRRYADIHK